MNDSKPKQRVRGVPILFDAEGAFLAFGLDRAEDVRAALSSAGVAFSEVGADDCGCGGPVSALFRLHAPVDRPRITLALEGVA